MGLKPSLPARPFPVGRRAWVVLSILAAGIVSVVALDLSVGTRTPSKGGLSIVLDFFKRELDNFLHKNPETADALQKRILQSERERKDLAGIKKLARERAKKANLHNKKLRDCRVHLNKKHQRAEESTLFITEGDSASGSITKVRENVFYINPPL